MSAKGLDARTACLPWALNNLHCLDPSERETPSNQEPMRAARPGVIEGRSEVTDALPEGCDI